MKIERGRLPQINAYHEARIVTSHRSLPRLRGDEFGLDHDLALNAPCEGGIASRTRRRRSQATVVAWLLAEAT